MNDFVVADSQLVKREPTEEEKQARRTYWQDRTGVAATAQRLASWEPLTEKEAARKLAAEIGHQNNLAYIEGMVSAPVAEFVTSERQPTARELEQRERDAVVYAEVQAQEQAERVARREAVESALQTLGLSPEQMQAILSAAQRGELNAGTE